jgi:uncharacterized membrane protein YphA (DoxX/SURF4 family)
MGPVGFEYLSAKDDPRSYSGREPLTLLLEWTLTSACHRYQWRGQRDFAAVAGRDAIGGDPMTMTTSGKERIAKRMGDFSSIFLRLALGVSFLSAVGDRFGFWGPFGQSPVAWGDFSHFTAYTAKLNWFMPSATIPGLAWASTCAETLLGVALLLGCFTRVAALLSGLLLLLFALAMTFALSLEAPLSSSVFSASGGAFLLATCSKYSWSLDSFWLERTHRARR